MNVPLPPNADFFKTLSEIHQACFAKGWSKEEFEVLYSQPGNTVLTHVVGNKIVGFIWLRAVLDEAEILTFAVLPQHQKKGIGGMLLERAMSAAKTHNAAHVFLEVSEKNPHGQNLYHRAGFTESHRRKAYYADEGNADAIVMQKNL